VSEQNILNPAQTSLFNPDWGYTEGLPETRSLFQAASGKMYSRREFGLGRVYDLAWNNRDLATKHALQQWAQQYENDFFSLADWERARYFSGRFEGPLTFNPAGNQKYNIKGRFIELPGLALFSYPTNWARDAIFLEERNGFGEDLLKVTGTWTYSNTGTALTLGHGGAYYYSNTTGDTAQWAYFGYGHRVWSIKAPDAGILNYTVTRIRDGAAISGPGPFDQYAASVTAAAVLISDIPGSTLPLDWYRVKLTVTGTKNASSSNFFLYADVLEVMQ
jgi:hypothetical protein